MKKNFVAVFALAFFLLLSFEVASATSVTWDRFSSGNIRPLFLMDTTWANIFTATSTTQASTFPYASTTALSATYFCLTGDPPCRSTWSSGGTPGGSDTQVQFNDAGSFGGARILYTQDSESSTFQVTNNSASLLSGFAFYNLGSNGDINGGDLTYRAGNSAGSFNGEEFGRAGNLNLTGGNIDYISPDTETDWPGAQLTLQGGSRSANRGGGVTLNAGTGDGLSDGGSIEFTAGSADAVPGHITFTAGSQFNGTDPGGSVTLNGGSGGATAGGGGSVYLTAGSAQGGDSNGGSTAGIAGNGFGTGQGGDAGFAAGQGGDTGNGGTASFNGGTGGETSGSGGNVTITAGSAQGGDSDGGNIKLQPGSNTGAGTLGHIIFIKPQDGFQAIFDIDAITANRTFTYPDQSGTLCIVGVLCDGSGGGTWAFTPTTNFAQAAQSTTTQLWLKATGVSLAASSTAWFDQINVGSTTVGTMSTSTFYGNANIQGVLKLGSASSYIRSGATSSLDAGLSISSGCFAISTNCLSLANLPGQVTLTTQVTGVLPIANGGTGTTTAPSGQLIYGGGEGVYQSVATGTISSSGGITTTSGRAAVGGALAISCDVATKSVPGCLAAADFNSFNGKVATGTTFVSSNVAYFGSNGTLFNEATGTLSASGGVSVTGSRYVLNGSAAITCDVASASIPGCLTAADFATFSAKLSAYDPFTHPAAGQSATTSVMIFTSGGLVVNAASSTIQGNLLINGNSTTTAATSTWSFATNASSSKLYGAGLSDCDTALASKLLWSVETGLFSCGTDQTGSGSGSNETDKFSTSTVDAGAIYANSASKTGFGTTTPWGSLSVSSSSPDYITPLFAIGTSSQFGGNLASVFATSTALTSNLLKMATTFSNIVVDSGVRWVIGEFQNYQGLLLDQLNINGRINTGEWFLSECTGTGPIPTSAAITASTGNVCGQWIFRIDSAGQLIGGAQNAAGALYISSPVNTTNGGGGIFSGAGPYLKGATSTPILDFALCLNGSACAGLGAANSNATSTMFAGFTDINPTGTGFEADPTAGCYITASSTILNLVAVCRSSATAVTQFDTGFSSTTNYYIRFRIEMDAGGATFYAATPTTTLKKITTMSGANYAGTTFLSPSFITSRSTKGLATAMMISYMRLWYRKTLWPN